MGKAPEEQKQTVKKRPNPFGHTGGRASRRIREIFSRQPNIKNPQVHELMKTEGFDISLGLISAVKCKMRRDRKLRKFRESQNKLVFSVEQVATVSLLVRQLGARNLKTLVDLIYEIDPNK
jgi:hypothetical protein